MAIYSKPSENVPLVSIVIVAYNQELFIAEAINSALNQGYKNIEIIVSDDCSFDKTALIIREFEEKYPVVVRPIYSKNNVGITANCNRGLRAARGKYICWLGGDDILLEDKVKKQVEWMEADDSRVVCYSDVDVFDSGTNETMWYWFDKYRKREGGASEVILFGSFMCACSVMFRRSSLPDGLCHDDIPISSDLLLVVETLIKSGGKIGYVDGVFSRYRRHANNITNDDQHALRENLRMLDIIQKKYPAYTRECENKRAEVLFVEAFRMFKSRDIRLSLLNIVKSFVSCKGRILLPISLVYRKLILKKL